MIAMRKLLIYYLVISFLLVIVYALFVINAYVSIKYEVETLYNDVIVSMIYQIFDTGIIVNFIGLDKHANSYRLVYEDSLYQK